MSKVIAVAMLDVKRLWAPIVGAGILMGILPTLAMLIGRLDRSTPSLPFAFLAGAAFLTAIICGFFFGTDFADGKPSFFFARPLPTATLLSGRIVAVIALCLASAAAFSLAYGLTGRIHLADVFRQITPLRLAVLPAAWSVMLFMALARVTSTRQTAKKTVGYIALQLARVAVSAGFSAIFLGLFFDVFLRAINSRSAIMLLFGSYAAAALVIACLAIDRGRTDRLRISRVLVVGTYVQTALVGLIVTITWLYLLHPPPSAMREITTVVGSPDGRVAYVAAHVDRGGRDYQPFFSVNLDSGAVERLATEYDNGWRPWLWHSRDGSTKVWAEQRPLLFGLTQRALLGGSTFRFQTAFGQPQVLPLPDDMELESSFPLIERPIVLPASGSDVVGVLWNNHGSGQKLAFVSPSRGQLSLIDLGQQHRAVSAWAFGSPGHLRAGSTVGSGTDRRMQVIDIDVATGAISTLTDQIIGETPRFHFSATADRALVVSGPADARTVSLFSLDEPSLPAAELVTGVRDNNLQDGFLAEGTIAVIVRQPPTSELRLFSSHGKLLFTVPLGVGYSTLGNQPFANTVTVATNRGGEHVLSFIDATTGAIVRQMAGYYVPQTIAAWFWYETPPAPGTPGARLLMSNDRRLVMLPSLSEEPRQLLPRQ